MPVLTLVISSLSSAGGLVSAALASPASSSLLFFGITNPPSPTCLRLVNGESASAMTKLGTANKGGTFYEKWKHQSVNLSPYTADFDETSLGSIGENIVNSF